MAAAATPSRQLMGVWQGEAMDPGPPSPTLLQPFLGWPACKAGSLRQSSTLLDTPRRTPMEAAIDLTSNSIPNYGFHLANKKNDRLPPSSLLSSLPPPYPFTCS
jgi:hypothetical protein